MAKKRKKQKFEGTTINEKDKVIPQQPPSNAEIVYETEYPQLGKQNKRTREDVSPTDYITNCCKIKLNSKRKSDLCSCAKKFCK